MIYLYIENDDTAVEKCSFTESSADGDGGSLYLYVKYIDITVVASSFQYSIGNDGGAVYMGNDNVNGQFVDSTFSEKCCTRKWRGHNVAEW